MRLDLDGLANAAREALMSEWREVVGRPPPKRLSRPLMIQILSHAYQLDTLGGYTKRLDDRLRNTARRDVVRPAFKPGSRFVREYHGITHLVEVRDDDLSDTERQRLESYAKMLLMTASPSGGDYKAQIQRMYPRLDSGLQLLLAQLLQEIEPREIAPDPLIKNIMIR